MSERTKARDNLDAVLAIHGPLAPCCDADTDERKEEATKSTELIHAAVDAVEHAVATEIETWLRACGTQFAPVIYSDIADEVKKRWGKP